MPPVEAAGPSPEAVEAEEEIPDWLRLLREEGLESELPSEEQLAAVGLMAEQPPAAEAPPEPQELPATAGETPDWLRLLREEGPESELPSEQEPSWKRILRGQEMGIVSQEHLEEAGLVQTEAEVQPEAAQPEAEELPDWLRQAAMDEGLVEASAAEVSPATEAAPATEVAPVPEPLAAAPVKPALDWLDILRADGLAEAILPEGPAPTEAAAPTVEAKAVADPAATEEIPTWMQILQQARGEPAAEVKTADIAEDKPELLQPTAAEPPSEVSPAAQPGTEVTPDWIADLSNEAAAGEEAPEAEQPAPAVETTTGSPIDAAIIAGFENAVQNNPKDYLTRWKLTQAHAAAGNHDAAIAHSQKLLEADEMVPQVAEYLKSAVDSGVQTRQAYQLLGDAYFKGGHLEEALDAYRKALSLLY
jgi:hypothetical protein